MSRMPRINEFVFNHTGIDTREYVEVFGDPNASLADLWLVLIEGDSGTTLGNVIFRTQLGLTNADGIWWTGFLPQDSLQNGTQTLLLVRDFTGTLNQDLDTDNDGVLDATPWAAIVDGIAVSDGGANDRTYAGVEVLGPAFAGGAFAPGGASRIPDGDGAWTRNAFNGEGIPGLPGGPVAAGEARNTPGALNAPPPPPPPGPVITRISAVQGPGDTSPLLGQTVTVEAIVIGDFQNGDADTKRNLGGFFLQEEMADWDADPLTSEGLFIFQPSAVAGAVSLGDRVRVTGTVEEFFGLTQLRASAITVVQAGAVEPADILSLAVPVTLPTAGVTLNQNGRFQPDLERFEGMLVRFPQTLTISEQFNLDRFNEIRLYAGEEPGERPFSFTQVNDPSVAGFEAHLRAVGARTITYDDGINAQNLPVDLLDGFAPYATVTAPRMGDTITGLTGVLDYQWAGAAASGSTWRVRSVLDGSNEFTRGVNPRPDVPDVGGTLKVASFNVLNFFTTLNTPGASTAIGLAPRGANSTAEFDRQAQKLVTTLLTLDADIIGLNELENDFLAGSAGNALAFLVDLMNETLGENRYAWVDPGVRFLGDDAIAVGFIFDTGAVRLAEGTRPAILTDAVVASLDASLLARSTIGRIFDGPDTSRAVLAVTFEEIASGETFTAAINHFKSKSGTGTGADADRLDGQGNWVNQRLLAAEALNLWLATNPTGSTDPDKLILGDLNAYMREDPIRFLLDRGWINPLFDAPKAYSFVFDGQKGSLDHMLLSPSLFGQMTGIADWHINADEADALDYNLDFGRLPTYFDGMVPWRTSDHDPLLLGLRLAPAPFPNAVSSGDVDQDSAVLWALVPVRGAVRVEWSTDPTFATLAGSATVTVTDPTLPVKVLAKGLEAGTRYHYRFIDSLGRMEEGTFATAHALGVNAGFRFGVSGDWRGELAPFPAIANAAARDLDLFVKLGDTIYADYATPLVPKPQAETLAEYRLKHAEVYGKAPGPNFWGALQKVTPILATIDDHEVINDFSGGAPASSDPRFPETTGLINETELFCNGLQAFQEYNAIEDRVWSGTGDARVDGRYDLYRYQTFGSDAAVFVLDARSFRDAPIAAWNGTPADLPRFLAEAFTPGRTMLGRPQIERLKADLLDAEAKGITWKFVHVPEPIQNLGPLAAVDRFEGYAAERTELLRFIDENRIDNVVFVAADVHGTVTNNLTYQRAPGGAQIALPSFEITTGSVAFDPPFAPAAIGLARALGLITPAQFALWQSLPIAPDGDSIPNDKDDVFKLIIDQNITPLGYDPVGLNAVLPQARALLEATLLQGDYLAAHTYGWTEFDVDAVTGILTVRTWGIDDYRAKPDGSFEAPRVVSEFTVEATRAITFDLAKTMTRFPTAEGPGRNAQDNLSTGFRYQAERVAGVQDSRELTDSTGSHVNRFLASLGDVTIREAFFERGPSQTGAVATLDWIDRDTALLRNEAGYDAVRGVRIDEFSGKALTVRGFQDVQLRLDGHGAQTLTVEGARWAFVLTGFGDDAIAITIGAQGRGGAQVYVDGGAGDDVIELAFAAEASAGTISSARQTVKGGAGDDVIIGRGGTVVALYDGLREDFSITRAPDGRFVIVDLNPVDGDEGTDLLAGVAQLQFADALVRLDDTLWL
ncbi:ExeM/NucH family extracellular endonuclease [Elioraea thermophila]|uniref:ExeM/NucH family extracellular endonuclease n=1 Tax=Elioraea thermophila TaxID=2185104 RepID=UPI0018E4E08B|nr:ExeM/NucH family extracellular endonuclease [Elioraea thermophila]